MATQNGNGKREARGADFLVKFVKAYKKAQSTGEVAKVLGISPAMVSTYASKIRKGDEARGFAPIALKKFPKAGREGGLTREQWADIAKAAQGA